MLSGRAPFESASPRELLNLQCTTAPPPLPEDARAGLPRGIERLVFALLEKRPDARPASAAAVLDVLDEPVLFFAQRSGHGSSMNWRERAHHTVFT